MATKATEHNMKCYTCGEETKLVLDNTADDERDKFAKKHTHNPDWSRWLYRRYGD